MRSCFLIRNRAFLFLWAAVTGFLFALVFKQYEQTIHETLTYYRITPSSFNYQWAYKTWLSSQGLHSLFRKQPSPSDGASVLHPRPNVHNDETSEDRWLAKRVSVLCIVLSKQIKQSRAVKNTWAKHCNQVLFFGEFEDNSIPVKRIRAQDGWHLLCEVLRTVWKDRTKYGDDKQINWVLVASDRTYAIIENLRYMVAGLDWNESLYLGHTYRDYDGQYNVHDAGYVLSWGAVTVLGERFIDKQSCSDEQFWRDSDRTLGHVLHQAGINCRDTRDVWEKSRFLPYNLEKLLIPGSISVFSNYWRQSSFLSPEGAGCCSDFVVTLNDVAGDKMYMLEYVVYHLKPVSNHWPIPVEQAAGSQPRTVPKQATPTTVKPKPVGVAFVADLSAGRNKGLLMEAAPSKSVLRKDKLEIEKQMSADMDRYEARMKPVINGHMNKVAEMKTISDEESEIEDFADMLNRPDFVLEEDDDRIAVAGARKQIDDEFKDDIGNNRI